MILLLLINGKTVRIKEGEGIFVNSRQLHYGFSKDFGECIFICILIHPVLLCASAYVEQKYVEPVLEHENMPYLVLHPDKEYEKEILEMIGKIDRCCSGELFAITAQRLFLNIWEKLFLLSGHVEEKTVAGNQQLSILKDMLRFIYQNYDRKISLDQICQAGKVGKTTCCAVFRRYTNESPVSYLIGYRLKFLSGPALPDLITFVRQGPAQMENYLL